jgi:hypothetical protein
MSKDVRHRAIHLVGAFALAACASTPSDTRSTWQIEKAEALYADGRASSALRYTERIIEANHESPSEREVSLHVGVLRALGHDSEANAFQEFTERYASGEHTAARESDPTWRQCKDRQPGDELIKSWGRSRYRGTRNGYEMGSTVAASFRIDSEGRIDEINVIRAKDPGVAWRVIQMIAGARLSGRRLAERRKRYPESFPVSLCIWANYNQFGTGAPPINGAIRGVQ